MSRSMFIEKNQRPRPNRQLATADIVRFESGDKYVTAHGLETSLTLKETLKALEVELSERFFRTHVTHLVELDRIVKIVGKPHFRMFVQVRGVTDLIPLGRRVLPRLLARRPDLKR